MKLNFRQSGENDAPNDGAAEMRAQRLALRPPMQNANTPVPNESTPVINETTNLNASLHANFAVGLDVNKDGADRNSHQGGIGIGTRMDAVGSGSGGGQQREEERDQLPFGSSPRITMPSVPTEQLSPLLPQHVLHQYPDHYHHSNNQQPPRPLSKSEQQQQQQQHYDSYHSYNNQYQYNTYNHQESANQSYRIDRNQSDHRYQRHLEYTRRLYSDAARSAFLYVIIVFVLMCLPFAIMEIKSAWKRDNNKNNGIGGLSVRNSTIHGEFGPEQANQFQGSIHNSFNQVGRAAEHARVWAGKTWRQAIGCEDKESWGPTIVWKGSNAPEQLKKQPVNVGTAMNTTLGRSGNEFVGNETLRQVKTSGERNMWLKKSELNKVGRVTEGYSTRGRHLPRGFENPSSGQRMANKEVRTERKPRQMGMQTEQRQATVKEGVVNARQQMYNAAMANVPGVSSRDYAGTSLPHRAGTTRTNNMTYRQASYGNVYSVRRGAMRNGADAQTNPHSPPMVPPKERLYTRHRN